MGEAVFKEIEGYPLYLIGSDGSVYSKKSNRFLKPVLQHTGYKHIELRNENGPKQFSVHRLVAKAFIPNPNNYPVVNHIDQNRVNNAVTNLEWCTYEYNSNHADCQKRKRNRINYYSEKQLRSRANMKNRNGKMVFQYSKEGEYIRSFPSTMEVYRETGINPSHVGECARGKRKAAGGYLWSFNERRSDLSVSQF